MACRWQAECALCVTGCPSVLFVSESHFVKALLQVTSEDIILFCVHRKGLAPLQRHFFFWKHPHNICIPDKHEVFSLSIVLPYIISVCFLAYSFKTHDIFVFATLKLHNIASKPGQRALGPKCVRHMKTNEISKAFDASQTLAGLGCHLHSAVHYLAPFTRMKYQVQNSTASHRFHIFHINIHQPQRSMNFDAFAPLPEPVPPAQIPKLICTQALLLRFHGGSRVSVSPPRAKGLL